MVALLNLGADINAGAGRFSMIYSPIEISIKLDNLSMVTTLLEFGADIHANDDHILRLCVEGRRIEEIKKLLEHGANLYCANNQILKDLQKNFNKTIADAILPYCDADDYEYFPVIILKRELFQQKEQKID